MEIDHEQGAVGIRQRTQTQALFSTRTDSAKAGSKNLVPWNCGFGGAAKRLLKCIDGLLLLAGCLPEAALLQTDRDQVRVELAGSGKSSPGCLDVRFGKLNRGCGFEKMQPPVQGRDLECLGREVRNLLEVILRGRGVDAFLQVGKPLGWEGPRQGVGGLGGRWARGGNRFRRDECAEQKEPEATQSPDSG